MPVGSYLALREKYKVKKTELKTLTAFLVFVD